MSLNETEISTLVVRLDEHGNLAFRKGGTLAVNRATLKGGSIEFEMVLNNQDANYHHRAIRDAFVNRTAVELAIFNGDVVTTGSQGLRASFMITDFIRSDRMDGVIKVSVTAKPTYSENSPEWMTIP